ncbi:G6PDH family F420-dependent oxidoreductase [Motilibacter rhizosphaerae]|uniref:G6PDH family F420-dependent oxidoreductase n=1 Tax=Motilibacter rhizosphaerae TaxID=598652 RepID=A0A4Q7NQN9_9ACTN|nr:LLM class F420-dependent oxidoreductase [Motilibacter rhizosphaerae]RZS87336.1 G6PDH family F420-dependent oxidoreductase [Motilibacter rhizosphaerae]
MDIGYTIMGEQAGPRQLVRDAVRSEQVGYDFLVSSDHYFPWLDSQGHAPYAWSVLGAVAQATERIPFMTYVTCPLFRYHPAVVAQKAATLALLSEGRFTLGLGAGENLNEHVVGLGWPPVDVRHEMFTEALEIIKGLFDGGYVTFHGQHYDVESAKLWDLPDEQVQIGIAVSGPQSCSLAGEYADLMIATEPKPELGELFDAAGGAGKPRVGQLPVSFGRDEDAAVQRAHDQFRWFGLTWKVNAELPGTAAFAAASQFVRPEDVAESIPCGDDPAAIVEALKAFDEAGFTHVALCQIGADTQEEFLAWSESELLPELRKAFPGTRSLAPSS